MQRFKIANIIGKRKEALRQREKYDVGKIAGVEMERKNTEKKVTELILSSSLHF